MPPSVGFEERSLTVCSVAVASASAPREATQQGDRALSIIVCCVCYFGPSIFSRMLRNGSPHQSGSRNWLILRTRSGILEARFSASQGSASRSNRSVGASSNNGCPLLPRGPSLGAKPRTSL